MGLGIGQLGLLGYVGIAGRLRGLGVNSVQFSSVAEVKQGNLTWQSVRIECEVKHEGNRLDFNTKLEKTPHILLSKDI